METKQPQIKINYPFIFTLVVFFITTIAQYVTMKNEVTYVCKEMENIKQQIKDYNVLTFRVNQMDSKLDEILIILTAKKK